ncbi:hypothetical protein Bhyg_14348, partial [Pseudolycoriella hygida]
TQIQTLNCSFVFFLPTQPPFLSVGFLIPQFYLTLLFLESEFLLFTTNALNELFSSTTKFA